MVHADFAQYKTHTLAHGSGNGKQHARQRQLQRQFVVVVAAAQHGDGDAGQGDNHGEDGRGAYLLTQGEPGHDGGCDGCQRHEQLAELGADDDVALKQTEVADDVAHQSRKHHPQIGLGAGTGREGIAANGPEQNAWEDERDDHARQVQRQVAHALAAKLAQQRRSSPRERHSYRNQFTHILHGRKGNNKTEDYLKTLILKT